MGQVSGILAVSLKQQAICCEIATGLSKNSNRAFDSFAFWIFRTDNGHEIRTRCFNRTMEMTRKLTLASTAIAGVFAVSAMAEAGEVGASDIFDSARFYVGAHAGGIWGKGTTDLISGSYDSDFKAIGGILAGVDFVHENWLLGIEGDVGFGHRKIDAPFSCATLICRVNWNGHVRGRVGFVIDHITLFVAGGLAIASFDASDGLSIRSQTEAGWTIGGGAQVEVNDRWRVRVEFLHDEYNNIKPKGGYTSNDWSENTVRAAAIFEF